MGYCYCCSFTIIFLGIFLVNSLSIASDSSKEEGLGLGTTAGGGKDNRHLPISSCSRLQYEIQRNILAHDWGLKRLKFQQRLKRHPQYIVTIQSVSPSHDPFVELRCPGGGELPEMLNNRVELYFHESRFSASSVHLYDLHSIFPIHTGALAVRVRLNPLVILFDPNSHLGVSLKDIFWRKASLETNLIDLVNHPNNKEHREESGGGGEATFEIEKEIQTIFLRRIQPDVQKQIETIVRNATTHFLYNNILRLNN